MSLIFLDSERLLRKCKMALAISLAALVLWLVLWLLLWLNLQRMLVCLLVKWILLNGKGLLSQP